MKHLILLIFSLLLFACSDGKKVYWCGDHACINNKEKEAYFKKTMIVEIKELSKSKKKLESELEIIKKQAGIEDKKMIESEKTKNVKIKIFKYFIVILMFLSVDRQHSYFEQPDLRHL